MSGVAAARPQPTISKHQFTVGGTVVDFAAPGSAENGLVAVDVRTATGAGKSLRGLPVVFVVTPDTRIVYGANGRIEPSDAVTLRVVTQGTHLGRQRLVALELVDLGR